MRRRGRNGPDGSRGGDDGVGLGMVDVGAEVAGVGEVARGVRVPDHDAAGGVEVGVAGDPAGAAGEGACRGEEERGVRVRARVRRLIGWPAARS